MPNTYKSNPVIMGTTASFTIYPGLANGTAIVNSIVFSNIHPSNATTVTLEMVRGLTAYSLLTNATLPVASSLQALDSSVVLQENDSLRARAGNTGSVHAVVSVLEIT